MEVQAVDDAPASTLSSPPLEAPSRTKPASPYGVLPGSERLTVQWGVQSQVVPERDAGQRRAWGAQPSLSNIWSP